MTPSSSNMPPDRSGGSPLIDGIAEAAQEKVVLVMDLVESVRIMAGDERGTVDRWRAFLHHARDEVLPSCHGRLVKSLGDGFLAEFDEASDAVKAALTLHDFFTPHNKKVDAASRLYLRAGINCTHLYVDEQDVFGQGVNLAARVTTLAAPGETIITPAVRDAIVDGLDGETEDMGESYLKHLPEPVRTWRVWPVGKHTDDGIWMSDGKRRPTPPQAFQEDLRPTIAVIPFAASASLPEYKVVGELLADGVIAQLSRSQQLRVISRLSTTALRGRAMGTIDLQAQLNAQYALSGSYAVMNDRVVITAELLDVRHNNVVWSDRLAGTIADLLQADSELIDQLTNASAQAVLNTTMQRALVLPVPQLDSNALLLGGIALMHRSTPKDLDRARQLLDAVTERHQRVATPWAWVAKWHILQVMQGRTQSSASDFLTAISLADKALDLDPTCALAMAVKGHAMCHLGNDIAASHELLTQAVDVNPNEPMGWLYSSLWSTMWGDGDEALTQSKHALGLSPLDPQKYYFMMQLANGYFAKEMYLEAAEACRASMRSNALHLSTLRTLITCEFELGQIDEARKHFDVLLAHQPTLTVGSYLSVGKQSKGRQRVASVLRALGLPD